MSADSFRPRGCRNQAFPSRPWQPCTLILKHRPGKSFASSPSNTSTARQCAPRRRRRLGANVPTAPTPAAEVEGARLSHSHTRPDPSSRPRHDRCTASFQSRLPRNCTSSRITVGLTAGVVDLDTASLTLRSGVQYSTTPPRLEHIPSTSPTCSQRNPVSETATATARMRYVGTARRKGRQAQCARQ